MRVAIVGAGIAGLSCAEALSGLGHDVALFDKGRGAGGRMSTRRVQLGTQMLRFDHGAQYFTVRDPAFADRVARWERDGIVARWPVAGDDAWVGMPGMNAPVKAMADVHRVTWGMRIDALERHGHAWQLSSPVEAGSFDSVVVAIPAEQAGPLLAPFQPEFAEAAAVARSAPCWTAMIAFAEPIRTELRIVRHSGAIGWAARDGSKPGRGDAETWVVQATPQWSAANLERSPEEVAPELLLALGSALQIPLPHPTYLAAHRWRFARSTGDPGPGALWDDTIGLGACGDWLLAPRVEAAWLSGHRLAMMIG